MTSSSFKLGLVMPRHLRGALALFVLTMYLIGGVFHRVCDMDVTNASGGAVISLADKAIGHPEEGVVADYHCHGCFSVSVPVTAIGEMEVMPIVKVVTIFDTDRRGLPPGIDPPPPKSPT